MNEIAIDAMHRHCNYKGIVYPVIDWTKAKWSIDGNRLHFLAPDVDAYGRNGHIDIEEIYIGENYTIVTTTTTEHVEMWFKNSMETLI